jgi:hypothetical protein
MNWKKYCRPLYSRKFRLGLAGIVVIVASDWFNVHLSEAQIYGILGIIAVLIGGTAVEDAALKVGSTPEQWDAHLAKEAMKPRSAQSSDTAS